MIARPAPHTSMTVLLAFLQLQRGGPTSADYISTDSAVQSGFRIVKHWIVICSTRKNFLPSHKIVGFLAGTVTSDTFAFSGLSVTRTSHLPAPKSCPSCTAVFGMKSRNRYTKSQTNQLLHLAPPVGETSPALCTLILGY